MDELRTEQQSLRTLGEDTGGYAAVNMNDFTKAWDRVVTDSSNYYVLGYYPTNDRRDGRYRKIEVRVKAEGLDVRFRKGYNAPKGKPPAPARTVTEEKASPEVREAINSPVPLPGLRLKAYAAPFKGAAPNASIAVGIEASGGDLAFQPKDGKFVNDVELSVVAIDTNGKIKDGDRTLLNMGSEARHPCQGRAGRPADADPSQGAAGRYQVRFAAAVKRAAAISGRSPTTWRLPDFAKEPLSMSGILLAAASRQQVVTAKPDEELKNVLPAAPTATREFPAGDTLAMFVEIYDNDVKTPHKVNITTKVVADDGHDVVQDDSRTRHDRTGRQQVGRLRPSAASAPEGHAAGILFCGSKPSLRWARTRRPCFARYRSGCNESAPTQRRVRLCVRHARIRNRIRPSGGVPTFRRSSPRARELTDRKISMCHLPPPQGSMTSAATTSTRISENSAALRDRLRGGRPARPSRSSGRASASGTDRSRRRRR